MNGVSPAGVGPWRALLEAAVLAPSSHNTQPWLFASRPGGLALHADRTRALPVNDPDDRELVISCACALFNLRVAAAHHGWRIDVRLFPDLADDDVLAEFDLAPGRGPEADGDLFPAIAVRQTWRRAFMALPVPDGVTAALAQAAAAEGAWLLPFHGDGERHALADLVADGDAVLWANPSWRRELAAWMHPRRMGDGIVVPGLAAPIAQQVVRTFDLGEGRAARDRQLVDGSPLLMVLGTPGDGPAAWVAAGQALQRVLLLAARHGLQASYLNQAVQVPALRLRLQQLCGGGFAQAVLRLGTPQGSVTRAPRRPLDAAMLPGLPPAAP